MFARDRPGRCAIVAALAFGALQCAFPASAASGRAYCASGAGPRVPAPAPKELEADVASTFGVPVDVVRRGGYVRCANFFHSPAFVLAHSGVASGVALRWEGSARREDFVRYRAMISQVRPSGACASEKVSPSMIWRFFDRHDITFKKNTHTQ